jgi:hypothetical protein
MALLVALVLAGSLGGASTARADKPKEVSAARGGSHDDGAPDDPRVTEARQRYQDGLAHVQQSEWAEALDDFERSAALRPHAVTSYNEGASLRALGRYLRARAAFREAKRRNDASPGELPAQLVKEADAFLAEIASLLGRLDISLAPRDARIAVDGAPVAVEPGEPGHAVAGLRPGGKGETAPAARFTVEVDPGAHVLMLSREGYGDVVVNRTVAPGATELLQLTLDQLPATIRVTASTDRAVVEMDGQLLGFAPVKVERPHGAHLVRVRQEGYETYETQVKVKAGEQITLRATLAEEQPSVLTRWWFWTAAGVAVTGTVVATYMATRPEPERPPLDGGGLGWVVPLR